MSCHVIIYCNSICLEGRQPDGKNGRDWYDGFMFGEKTDIYNPWSIINYLDQRKFPTYWADTSSNRLVGKLIREGNQNIKMDMEWGLEKYELSLTNKEVRILFQNMIKGWFRKSESAYNAFVKALLCADVKGMNAYMNKAALETKSFLDTGKKPSEETEPERFYHVFVLGLIVELAGRYIVTSNREAVLGAMMS